nr:MAG TPA: hypothetical protein [Caudoviricetes sp.]
MTMAIGDNIKIQVTNADWDYDYNLAFILDNLSIHWGRENFYKPPSNRTLSMAISLPKKFMSDTLLHWVNSEIIISSKNPNIVIFQGFIDSVKGFHQDYANLHDRYTLQIEATESPTWSVVFTNEVRYSANFRAYGNRVNEVNRQFGGLVFYHKNDSYLSMPKEGTLTVKQIAESLVWHPGAWPVWCPDWKRLASTLYTLDNPTGGSPWVLPADRVIDISPSYLFTEANSPSTILYTAGGIFGEDKEEKAGYDIRRHRDTDKGNTIILDTPYCPNTGGISNMAKSHAAVALLQPGGPRKMRVDTRRLPNISNDLNLWECWETPGRQIKINGDKLSADIWGVGQTIQDYYPIGGTLTVHPTYVTHDFYCAWGNRTVTTPTPPPPPPPIPPLPPRPPKRFATATTTWAETNTKWKDN